MNGVGGKREKPCVVFGSWIWIGFAKRKGNRKKKKKKREVIFNSQCPFLFFFPFQSFTQIHCE